MRCSIFVQYKIHRIFWVQTTVQPLHKQKSYRIFKCYLNTKRILAQQSISLKKPCKSTYPYVRGPWKPVASPDQNGTDPQHCFIDCILKLVQASSVISLYGASGCNTRLLDYYSECRLCSKFRYTISISSLH